MAMSLAKTGTFIQAFPEPYYKDTLRAPVAPGQMARKLYELNSSRRSMGGTGNGSLSPRALSPRGTTIGIKAGLSPIQRYRYGNYPQFENPAFAAGVVAGRAQTAAMGVSPRSGSPRLQPLGGSPRAMSPRAAQQLSPRAVRIAQPPVVKPGDLRKRYASALEAEFGNDYAQNARLPARMFERIDKDRNSGMDKDELLKSMMALQMNVQPGEIDAMMKECDLNGDGKIDFEEFQYAIMKMERGFTIGVNQPKRAAVLEHELGAATDNLATPEEITKYITSIRNAVETKYSMLRKAFLAADADRSGYLSKEEVVTTIKHFALPIPLSHIYQIFDEILDKDGDGEVSYTEFCDKLKSSEF